MAKTNKRINMIKLKIILLIVQVVLFIASIVLGIVLFNVVENMNTIPFIVLTIILIPTTIVTLLSLQKDAIVAVQDDEIMNGDNEHLKRFLPFIMGANSPAAKSADIDEKINHKK